MTEKKRFTTRSYDGINCHIYDKSIVIAQVHRSDVINLCDLLNALHEENEYLREGIVDAFHHERTDLGRSVLRQLAESLGVGL